MSQPEFSVQVTYCVTLVVKMIHLQMSQPSCLLVKLSVAFERLSLILKYYIRCLIIWTCLQLKQFQKGGTKPPNRSTPSGSPASTNRSSPVPSTNGKNDPKYNGSGSNSPMLMNGPQVQFLILFLFSQPRLPIGQYRFPIWLLFGKSFIGQASPLNYAFCLGVEKKKKPSCTCREWAKG